MLQEKYTFDENVLFQGILTQSLRPKKSLRDTYISISLINPKLFIY